MYESRPGDMTHYWFQQLKLYLELHDSAAAIKPASLMKTQSYYCHHNVDLPPPDPTVEFKWGVKPVRSHHKRTHRACISMSLDWNGFWRVSLQWQTSSGLKNSNVGKQQVVGRTPAGYMWQYITSTCDWEQLRGCASSTPIPKLDFGSFSTSSGVLLAPFYFNPLTMKKPLFFFAITKCPLCRTTPHLITLWHQFNRGAEPALANHQRRPVSHWWKGWLISTAGGTWCGWLLRPPKNRPIQKCCLEAGGKSVGMRNTAPLSSTASSSLSFYGKKKKKKKKEAYVLPVLHHIVNCASSHWATTMR